jgi:prepilin-type processing-associated H-X9-DG protein
LRRLLDSLVLPDLTALSNASTPVEPQPGSVPGERPVPGFVCSSDPYLNGPTMHSAPISYRAATGDEPSGANGGFAPGRVLRLADVEDGDGQSFTAAFSERLIGRGQDAVNLASGYAVVDGPILGPDFASSPGAPRRGDAGASWSEASWRSTLYTHAASPYAASSCIARDGRTALMGASSGHVGGVNVLMFDGAVRTVSPTVAPPIWRALATTHSPAPAKPAVEEDPR